MLAGRCLCQKKITTKLTAMRKRRAPRRIRDVERRLPGTFELIDESRIEGTLSLDRTEFGVGSPRSRWNPLSVHDQVVVDYSASLPALQEAEDVLNASARRAPPAGVATAGGGG